MIKETTTRIFIAYAAGLLFILFLLEKIFFAGLLNETNFLHWDAQHYYWIKDNGYEGFRVAFFPLFPFLWKITGLTVYGIAAFNFTVFLFSFYFLSKKLRLETNEILLCLSIPSFFFFFLPFSESVFFACSTILLIGLKEKKNLLVMTGLFFATLARPAFTVFIPALILAEFICNGINSKSLSRIFYYLLVSGAGLFVVGIIQHHYTGIWFNFFEVQKGWGNELQVPKLPLTSWGGGLIERLDGSALLIGIVCGVFILSVLFKLKSLEKSSYTPDLIFSLCYLAGICATVLLFRGGSLFSLNRFVYAVPFIIVAIDFYLKHPLRLSSKQIALAFFALTLFWLAFGSYVHIQAFLKYFLLSVYMLLILLLKFENARFHKLFFWLLVSVNFVFQIIFVTRFLTGGWVA